MISLTSLTSQFKPWTEIQGCPVTLMKEFIFSQPKAAIAKTQTEFVAKDNWITPSLAMSPPRKCRHWSEESGLWGCRMGLWEDGHLSNSQSPWEVFASQRQQPTSCWTIRQFFSFLKTPDISPEVILKEEICSPLVSYFLCLREELVQSQPVLGIDHKLTYTACWKRF